MSAAAYELGGQTLTPGVYKIGAAATVASPIILDAQGDPQAVFIIQIAGALGTTASTGNVILTNDAQSTNVFWIVEGAVSLGASTHMEGNILGGAAITFGANTTINGRVMAGTAAGTIALPDTIISTATGTPPVGTPPPVVVATTLTDASGNYLFGNVQPGIYLIRWDLSGVTSDYAITTANLGGDEALDSNGVTGDVGGFVDTLQIEVLNGSTNLGIDLGLIETLPAIKAVALDELDTALASYLLANYYTAENWTALKTAKTDGDTAINAATDPAAVASAKDAALAAMAAVPTYAESLAAAKVSALDELSSALASYLESDYTEENWTALKTAKTDGEAAINAATDPAGVTAEKDSALAAMDAVPAVPAVPPAPLITDISRTSAGQVTLELSTTPNFLLTLQTSTNLSAWTTIATATPDTELWFFVHEAELATGPRRFYRAFLTP